MNTNWSEIRLSVGIRQMEQAAAIAQMTVPGGIYIEDYSDLTTEVPKIAHIDLIDGELLARDRSKAVIHLYISPEENPAEAVAFLTGRFHAESIPFSMETGTIREEDWANGWRKYYHPVKIGRRTVVCPSWEEYSPGAGEVVLSLDPGMAFGTGTHETTRLCVGFIEDYLKENGTVLDVGTGSGILSVAALLLGASSAVGCDIDKTAVEVAKENAAKNGVESKFTAFCGDLATGLSGAFDLICANIVADVIIRFAPDAPRFLKSGGILLVSGIIEERLPEVLAALEKNGFILKEQKLLNGWAAACLTRP